MYIVYIIIFQDFFVYFSSKIKTIEREKNQSVMYKIKSVLEGGIRNQLFFWKVGS